MVETFFSSEQAVTKQRSCTELFYACSAVINSSCGGPSGVNLHRRAIATREVSAAMRNSASLRFELHSTQICDSTQNKRQTSSISFVLDVLSYGQIFSDTSFVFGTFFGRKNCFFFFWNPLIVSDINKREYFLFLCRSFLLKMPSHRKLCCGYVPLRTGCIIFGVLEIIGCFLHVIAGIVAGNPAAVAGIIVAIPSVLMIVGAVKKNRHWMWPWIVLNCISLSLVTIVIVIGAIVFLLVFANINSSPNAQPLGLFIVLYAVVVLIYCGNVYKLYIVWCFMKELHKVQKRQLVPTDVEVSTVPPPSIPPPSALEESDRQTSQ